MGFKQSCLPSSHEPKIVELVTYLARVYGNCHSSAVQLAKAKTPEDRAKVDLKLHFMKKTLDEPVRAPIPH